ncbi:Demethylmenaquinone methyltransferase [Maioricimonas rarisocia]|uniref:Demethylmenaquinone methyltransferase n=1 Tax=Maioricimonas rarisocia TaxID=2528026 RepID=A0A517Z1N0_9PLAN|nr:methyltransferase domain-containing protein [Maioricimonas rarisocia]QDU36391.1 Demethylmenaquinone methyltransferase [Maioricimonas rarisocia]
MSEQNASSPQSNQAFYDRIAHAYDFIADANEHKARETGEVALNLQPGERVFEIGYGTGNTLVDIAKAVGESGYVAGLDVSPKMRDVAAGKVAEAQLATPVELVVGDARELPFGDNSFQAAFTSFTLELFEPEDIPKVLGEVKRVLQPGGRLGVVSMAVVPAGEHESGLEKTYKWMHQHFPHIVDCRPIDVDEVLNAAGFEVASSERMEIWTMPVAMVVARA